MTRRQSGPRRVVRVNAFAKINLTLRVLGTRADGYHDLETTFQSIALHDTLTLTEREGPFEIVCDDPACPTDATNLVWRAAERLWRRSGHRSVLSGLRVKIAKRIPAQAGLGGGSSDAAATLRALARLWRMDAESAPVRKIAASIGADVPFFLQGGSALGVGRGDVLHPLPDVSPFWVVLVIPSFGVSTADAYRWCDADRRRHSPPGPVGNDLQAPVARRHPDISRLVSKLERAGASYAAMSGSGSAVFGLFASRSGAQAAASGLTSRSRRTLVTRTLNWAEYIKEGRPR